MNITSTHNKTYQLDGRADAVCRLHLIKRYALIKIGRHDDEQRKALE